MNLGFLFSLYIIPLESIHEFGFSHVIYLRLRISGGFNDFFIHVRKLFTPRS